MNLVTGYEAESLTLTAMVSRHNAPVRWLKDWTSVSGERFYIGSEGLTRTLTIDPLKRLDSGEYMCDANTDEMHFSLLVKGWYLDAPFCFMNIRRTKEEHESSVVHAAAKKLVWKCKPYT